MSWLAKLRSASAGRIGNLAALSIGLVGIAAGLYQIVGYLTIYMLLASIIVNSNIDRSLLKNSKGDTVEFEIEFSPNRYDSDHIVIRLRRAYHWLSTTLLKAESHGFQYDAKWLDQNTVEITLVFGCLVRLKTPVTTVGPIHISYHLAEGGRHLGSCPPGTSPRSEPLPARIPGDH